MDLTPLITSLKVSLTATAIAFALGLAMALLVFRAKRGKTIADMVFAVPMVLPPTVVGFFLLMILGQNSAIGRALGELGLNVLFTWQGAVLAGAIVSFPIMYRTARGALEQVDCDLIKAARTLGMREKDIVFKILLPLARPGIASGTLLTFARAIGEFGATIMVAGNIPGKTQTMSIAIYTAMQSGDREKAYLWVGIILAISLAVILVMNLWNKGLGVGFGREFGKEFGKDNRRAS